jgi:hypothetical protein
MADLQAQQEEQETTSIRDLIEESTNEHVPEFDDETAYEDDPAPEEEGANDFDELLEQETPARGVAVDELLRDVESNLGSDYAQAIRNLQADHTRWHQNKNTIDDAQRVVEENRQLQQELKEALDEVRGIGEEEENQIDEELLSGVTEDHRTLFRALLGEIGPEWATQNGYVKQDDLNARDQAVENNRVMAQAADAGIADYGDHFGSRDGDGRFIINPEIRQEMEETYNRLGGSSFGGSLLDVYRIAFPGRSTQSGQSSDAIAKRRRARVESGSASARTTPSSIYKSGDKISSVVRKASALAFNELPSQ